MALRQALEIGQGQLRFKDNANYTVKVISTSPISENSSQITDKSTDQKPAGQPINKTGDKAGHDPVLEPIDVNPNPQFGDIADDVDTGFKKPAIAEYEPVIQAALALMHNSQDAGDAAQWDEIFELSEILSLDDYAIFETQILYGLIDIYSPRKTEDNSPDSTLHLPEDIERLIFAKMGWGQSLASNTRFQNDISWLKNQMSAFAPPPAPKTEPMKAYENKPKGPVTSYSLAVGLIVVLLINGLIFISNASKPPKNAWELKNSRQYKRLMAVSRTNYFATLARYGIEFDPKTNIVQIESLHKVAKENNIPFDWEYPYDTLTAFLSPSKEGGNVGQLNVLTTRGYRKTGIRLQGDNNIRAKADDDYAWLKAHYETKTLANGRVIVKMDRSMKAKWIVKNKDPKTLPSAEGLNE